MLLLTNKKIRPKIDKIRFLGGERVGCGVKYKTEKNPDPKHIENGVLGNLLKGSQNMTDVDNEKKKKKAKLIICFKMHPV